MAAVWAHPQAGALRLYRYYSYAYWRRRHYACKTGSAEMPKHVLTIGLDPSVADLTQFPGVTPDLVRSFIDSELE